MSKLRRLAAVMLLGSLAAGCTSAPAAPITSTAVAPIPASAPVERLGPAVDHHQHLLSPSSHALLSQVDRFAVPKEVPLPADVAELLTRRTVAWDDAKALADVYTDDAVVLEEFPVTGRQAAAQFVSEVFARPYAITPIAYGGKGSTRTIGALYTRGEGAERTNVGSTLISLERDARGTWRIAGETMKFPGPVPLRPLDGDDLIELLDRADIERAVVMSVAYFFENPGRPPQPALLRAENDWTAAQVARHPTRLVGFCSVNPLTEQALAEIERCASQLRLSGLKLHFGNSNVDLKTPAHLERMKQVFALANRLGLPVAAHLWDSGNNYGRRDAEIFLAELLPQAPDVVVQVMHMAGGGPGWTDEALEVFANAVEARDPRTRNLYFDVATVADRQTHEQLQLLAKRIRQVGPERILYGSDGAFGGNAPPTESWGHFRGMVPLTDAEFAIIRDNVAPYLG